MLRFTDAIISEKMNSGHRENPERARDAPAYRIECRGKTKKPSPCGEGFFCYLSVCS
jgi:hypothetical protein